jgi:hypothetical protein
MHSKEILKIASAFELLSLGKKKKKKSSKKKNIPTNKKLWSRAKAEAKKRFDIYPSIYANSWAAKWYKGKGGGWRKGNAANDGLIDDCYTDDELKSWYGDSNDVFENNYGELEAHGKVYPDSGLGKWFNKESPGGKRKGTGWVDISRKDKDGKHPPCGRPDASKGGKPKCRPAGEAKKMTKKEKESATNQKRQSERTKKRKGKKPIRDNHKKRD